MAFLHCHNCDFSQDDFWDDDYNPTRSLSGWERDLLSRNLDEPFTDDAGFIEQHGNLTWREVIAREAEKQVKKIRDMVYRTQDEYREKNPAGICPKCQQPKLDID